MINEELLQKKLDQYANIHKQPLLLVKYKKSIINNLFKKYKYYGMTEDSYCCHGQEQCCWQEVVEVGVWSLTLDKVKRNIELNIKSAKEHLYKEPRFFMYADDNICSIFIYLRDVYQVDYHIWFSNEDR